MHTEAYRWVAGYASSDPLLVLDIGGRDINGSPRSLFPCADYTVLDIAAGPNVHIVADAATWPPDREYDLVLCCEVFEHTPAWPQICATALEACRPGGLLIATMAGPGREPHSGVDGGQLQPGEHYQNVEPGVLWQVLDAVGWRELTVDYQPGPADVYAVARRW